MQKAILFTIISACFYFCLYFVTLWGINHYESLKTFNIISIFPIILTAVLAFLLGIIIKINFTNDISDRKLLAVILVVGLIMYLAVISVEYMR
ncbi:putative membrane protein [Geobacillus kaustophilus]|uniref:Putative membrane protein n=1 Tax=Geobacillus kaustophilus TaxID=1462 RepID=A0A0D8BU53_GEOKU|nr:putative membrane protein [Geobacillus kaustophilus]